MMVMMVIVTVEHLSRALLLLPSRSRLAVTVMRFVAGCMFQYEAERLEGYAVVSARSGATEEDGRGESLLNYNELA